MISSLLANENLIDNRIDIKFENTKVTIYRITRLQTTYTSNGIELIIEGDVSPNENGKFKRRSLHVYGKTYAFNCDYENINCCSEVVLDITVTKKSNDRSYFNRLSQRD